MAKMLHFISETAKYGDFVSGPRVINDETKRADEGGPAGHPTGKFAKQWIDENAAGKPEYNADVPGRPATSRSRRPAPACARKWPGCKASRTRRQPDMNAATPLAHQQIAGDRARAGHRRPARRRGAGARGRRRRSSAIRAARSCRFMTRCTGSSLQPYPGAPRAGGRLGRRRLWPGHGQAGRVPGDLGAGGDQSRHRHRQCVHGQRAHGRDHRPGRLRRSWARTPSRKSTSSASRCRS